MLADTRCERCHQAQGWPERAIKSCQEIDKGHKPQSTWDMGGRLLEKHSRQMFIMNAGIKQFKNQREGNQA